MTTHATAHDDEHGGTHSEATATDHEGMVVRSSMYVDELGRMALTLYVTDPIGATTKVFDLVERIANSLGNAS